MFNSSSIAVDLDLDVFCPQIYIFYGTRSNAEFVIHNGFFYQENAHDQVKIKLGISKSERLYAMKAEVLGRAGIPVCVPLSLAAVRPVAHAGC